MSGVIETVLPRRAADKYDILPVFSDAYALQEGGDGLLASEYGNGFYLLDRGTLGDVGDVEAALSTVQPLPQSAGLGAGSYLFSESGRLVVWQVEADVVHELVSPAGWWPVGAAYQQNYVFWLERELASEPFTALQFRLRRANPDLTGASTLYTATHTFISAATFDADDFVWVTADGIGYVGTARDAINNEVSYPILRFLTSSSSLVPTLTPSLPIPARLVAWPKAGNSAEFWFPSQAGTAVRLVWSGTEALFTEPLSPEWLDPPPATISVGNASFVSLYAHDGSPHWRRAYAPDLPVSVPVEPHPVAGQPRHLFPKDW